MNRKTSSLLIVPFLYAFSIEGALAADAPSDQWLKGCTVITNVRAKQQLQANSSASSSNMGLDFSIPNSALAAAFSMPLDKIPGLSSALGNTNIGYSSSNYNTAQHTTWSDLKSAYNAMKCEAVLKTYGQVTIAEINSDRDKALAKIDQEKSNYQQDTLKAISLIHANTQYLKIRSDAEVSKYIADTKKDIAIHSNDTSLNAIRLDNAGQLQREVTRGNSDRILEITKRREEAVKSIMENNQELLKEKEQDAKEEARSKFQF